MSFRVPGVLVLDCHCERRQRRVPHVVQVLAHGSNAGWIDSINRSGLRVVSVDVPSGLDADTGRAAGPCVRATTTVTLGLPKAGLLSGDGPAQAGEVWVADIGVPLEAYADVGLQVPPHLFAMHDRFQLSAVRL